MSNLEFILSLNPEQIRKFIEFSSCFDFKIGIIYAFKIRLMLQEENERLNYTWINNKWEKDNE